MSYEQIKQMMLYRKYRDWFVLEGKTTDIIVNKDFIKMFLCYDSFFNTVQRIYDTHYSYQGFHFCKELNKTFETHGLTSAGRAALTKFCTFQTKTLIALKELAENKKTDHLQKEKARIKNILEYNGINNVYAYSYYLKNNKQHVEETNNNSLTKNS